MTLTPAPPSTDHRPTVASPWSAAACRVAVTGSAAGGALIAWTVGASLGDVDLVVGTGADARTIGPGSVLLVSALAALAALALAAVLARVAHRPRRAWQVVAATVLLVSLLGPLGAASFTAGVQLLALHATVALALFTSVPRMLPARRPAHDPAGSR